MSKELKKNVVSLTVGEKKYRYTEVLEDLFPEPEPEPEIIDLTKESIAERRSAARKLRLDVAATQRANRVVTNECFTNTIWNTITI